ncbi:hypothetical protein [Microbulbifer mangrovi]|uniref:hypothetical protein n=1 Tax=Microbulbifer mangrovi TaxID=927787 RepID=UPI0009903584|nr:hypothetical protein [Microbulbifer mangrovi]
MESASAKLSRHLGLIKWIYIFVGLLCLAAFLIAPNSWNVNVKALYAYLPFVGFIYLMEIGVRRGVTAALYATYIFSVLLLFVFPVGTVIGIFLLISCVSVSKETKKKGADPA